MNKEELINKLNDLIDTLQDLRDSIEESISISNNQYKILEEISIQLFKLSLHTDRMGNNK